MNDKQVHGLKIKSVPRTFINTTNKNKGCMGTIQTCSFDKQTFNCTRRTIHKSSPNLINLLLVQYGLSHNITC